MKVTSYNLAEQTFTLKTYRFGNCDGQSEPEWRFYMEYYTPTDAYGNPMTVVKFGGTLTHKVRLHFLKEGSQPGTVKIPCGGCVLCPPTVTCENGIVGNKVYSEYTQFENGSVKLGEFDGKPLGNGIYEVTESLVGTKIGHWEGSMLGKATVKKIHYEECNCTPLMDYPWEVQKLFKIPITFWCVDVKMDPLPSAEVDNEGYLLSDYEIKYRIEPAEYTAMNTQVFIYENDTLIVNLIGDKSGEGKVTLGRGFHVDVNKNYSTEVVLNYGTGSEIRSNKVPLIFNHYDIHGKFKITDTETEMQEDYEPGERVLRTLGGMRIHLEAFMEPPLEVEEYEWSATSGTTFYSSYDTNAGILIGDALKGSNLKEIYWEGDNKVNQEAEIKLKITFKDSPEHIITKKIKTRVLSYLDKGDDVKMLQAFMRMMGISEKDTGYSGTPVTMDGNFTMRTEKALKAFQMADEVSKSGIADDALLARVRIHWVDYKKAIDTKPYPDHPKMNNTYSHAGYPGFKEWVQDAADYFQNQPYGTTMMNAIYPISGVTLVKAWIDQESALAGQWGYKGIPFRISLGGADEMGSIGFSQICNKWKYGAKPENLIKSYNPYNPEDNIKVYRVWADDPGLIDAFIGNPPPYKKSKNYAWPYFPILVATNNVPINNYYEDDDLDCLSKGIMAYNHGHCNYELTWPEMLRAINNPLGQLPYDKRWGVQYALQVKQRAKLALKTWTWKCQRINVGKNKKCDTYIHPWDTPLIAFGSSSSEENQICILPSKNGMLYSIVNRDENGNLVKNSDDVLEEFEFQFSEEEWLSGTTWVQKMLREGAIRN